MHSSPGSCLNCDPVHARFSPVQPGSGLVHDALGFVEEPFVWEFVATLRMADPVQLHASTPLIILEGIMAVVRGAEPGQISWGLTF